MRQMDETSRPGTASVPTPTCAEMLSAVLLSVASEVARARLPALEADVLAQRVRERLMGLGG